MQVCAASVRKSMPSRQHIKPHNICRRIIYKVGHPAPCVQGCRAKAWRTHLLRALLKLALESRALGAMASDMTGSGTLMDVIEYLRALGG